MTIQGATITCPKCGATVPLTETLAGPLLEQTRKDFTAQIDAARSAAKDAIDSAKTKEANLEEELKARMHIQRDQADILARKNAEAASRAQLEDLERQLLQQRVQLTEVRDAAQREAAESVRSVHAEAEHLRAQLAEAQKAQAEALRHSRILSDKEAAMDLTIETGITQGITQAREEARRAADDAARLKLMERDQTIAGLQVKIEELAHKADVTSQQLAGEVQELDLEQSLRAKFPFDIIEEIGKGVNGADVYQTVISPSGAQCGVVLWESKRTRNWSAGWLNKLRDDLRTANADIPVIVTQAMPKDVDGFDVLDGVWVCAPKYALALATLLREGLLRVHAVRQAQTGMATKAELIYAYLIGKQFRHRIEAVVESFTSLQSDLDAEKKAITRAWAKRSAQIENALTATAGLFGDIQGIGGSAIPEIEALSTYALGDGNKV